MSAIQSAPEPSSEGIQGKDAAIPVEVVILTPDHEVIGVVHVSRNARQDRRISDLLNDPSRRFLAVTDARLISREGNSTPRLYSFLQLHIDNIIMIHPSAQTLLRNTEYSREEALRFDSLREKYAQLASEIL